MFGFYVCIKIQINLFKVVSLFSLIEFPPLIKGAGGVKKRRTDKVRLFLISTSYLNNMCVVTPREVNMCKKYNYCGVSLTKDEFNKLKKCSSLQYCAECEESSCIIDKVYPRVDSTKYSLDEFIFSLYLLEDF